MGLCLSLSLLISCYLELFHGLWAGAIPIYWGGENARSYLPANSTVYIPDYDSDAKRVGA